MGEPVPFFNIHKQHEDLRAELSAAIERALGSDQYILGAEVAAFEAEVADYLGVRHAITCASGTDALHLSLRSVGVKLGDEVITSNFSFIASAGSIVLADGVPVFADIDAASFNMRPESVRALVTPRTKAILVPHIYGHPADMAALQTIADEHGLVLIEDCAQSFGSTVGDRYTGNLSTIGCFSFYPTKVIGACGDGGMITTNDDALNELIRSLCNHGLDARQHSNIVGFNSRLDEMQAAILRVKLGNIDRFLQRRRQLAEIYSRELADVSGVSAPTVADSCTHAFNLFTIRCERRDDLAAHLAEQDIQTRIYYDRPLSSNPSMRAYRENAQCDESLACANSCLSLPIYPEMDDAVAQRIAETIARYLN